LGPLRLLLKWEKERRKFNDTIGGLMDHNEERKAHDPKAYALAQVR